MTYRTDSPYALEEEAYEADDEEPRRGLLSWILIIAMLMGTGSASAVVWRTFGGGPILSAMSSNPISAIAVAERPAAAASAPAQDELASLRQEIAASVQSTQQLLTAQQAEIKRLSDQVSALSSKLELIQRPVNSAQAAIPVPVAPQAAAPAAPKKKEAAKPVAAKPASSKPAADTKPATDTRPATGGPISTGGAPLQFNR